MGAGEELCYIVFVRLEEVAEQMHINLTKVIVNSCCPQIPCHRLTPSYDIAGLCRFM